MVELERVRFGYRGRGIFEAVDLVLEPGRIYGLLGLNGAGKSTLLKLLSGLLFPDSGRIRVFGHEPARRTPEFLAGIFMLSEALHLPAIPDRQYVSLRAPFYPQFDADLMERLLGELEVPRGQKLANLSLGERKKFALAFGLACRPSLLILDEPTNGLDIPSKGLFRRIVAESLTGDRILVIATHQVRDVEALIDTILVLHQGRFLLRRGMEETASGLRFSRDPGPPDPQSDALLYSEPAVGGYASVWADPDESGGQPDLELLFKAAIANPGAFARLFWEG
ncbi:MAG: ABC transporter ATP-binding protein [Defluviicoccus sp.]|nr:ABC transporter ATP-binding protein [Defluviicoccus sp.]